MQELERPDLFTAIPAIVRPSTSATIGSPGRGTTSKAGRSGSTAALFAGPLREGSRPRPSPEMYPLGGRFAAAPSGRRASALTRAGGGRECGLPAPRVGGQPGGEACDGGGDQHARPRSDGEREHVREGEGRRSRPLRARLRCACRCARPRRGCTRSRRRRARAPRAGASRCWRRPRSRRSTSRRRRARWAGAASPAA